MAAALCFVSLATLSPTGSQPGAMGRCLFCNPRMLADALANLLLFIPIGLALRLAGFRTRAVVAMGALLSGAIETVQLWVPGRDATPIDVLTNTAGACVAAVAVGHLGRWVAPPHAPSERLALGAAVLACASWIATGYLVAPSWPVSEYWGQWTPRLDSLEPYSGQVVSASVGDVQVAPHQVTNSARLRAALASRAPVRVQVVIGPPPARISSIFSIADAESRRLLLVGAAWQDLVFRYRTRAADWRLDQPDLRIPGAFATLAPGETTSVVISRQAHGYCAQVGSLEACGAGYGPGDGWSFLVSSGALTQELRSMIGAIWMAVIVAPVGYWARRGIRSGLAMAAMAGCLLLLPDLTDARPTQTHEWGGALVGLIGAVFIGRQHRTQVQHPFSGLRTTP